VLGCRQRLVPPTTAASHCPVRIARSAWSSARRLDEHAVSTAKLGPATAMFHTCHKLTTVDTGDPSLSSAVMDRD